MKLKATLPMTSVMYLRLVNTWLNTTQACSACRHVNGECIDYAKQGTCNAMNKKLNDILVFHDGQIEFATTRSAIAHALEVNQENDQNPWIGATVFAVIEDYLSEYGLNSINSSAAVLCELLSPSDIIAKIDWTETN